MRKQKYIYTRRIFFSLSSHPLGLLASTYTTGDSLPLSLLSSYSTTLSIHPSNPLDLQCHVGRLVGCQTERFAAPPPRNGEFARVCVSSLEEGCGEKIFDINNQ